MVNTTIIRLAWILLIILTILGVGSWPIASAQDHSGHTQHGSGSTVGSEHIHPGAISVTDGAGNEYKATVLGGPLGTVSANGVSVNFFVLQATSQQRLKPGGRGPTHIFNMTFVDLSQEEMLSEVLGVAVIEGGGQSQRVNIRPFQSHYQAVARLEKHDVYRIRAEFLAAGKSGITDPVIYTYKPKPGASPNTGEAFFKDLE